jgi:phosphopantothenoylcysteine decarboxylase/phosphopantothenate--cysteine ligase
VLLLIGQTATFRGERLASQIETFTTTSSLREKLRTLAEGQSVVDAVFHAAAVSDFTFGKIWCRSATGELEEIKSGKVSTRHGTLLVELVSTPKLLSELRPMFPKARLIGWKYEVEGDKAALIRAAEQQITQSLTDACVANGPSYGEGFGLVRGPGECEHLVNLEALFEALEQLARRGQ